MNWGILPNKSLWKKQSDTLFVVIIMGNYKKNIVIVTLILAFTALISVASISNKADNEKHITVFAASSTADIIKRIAEEYEAKTGVNVNLNIAATGLLARQIESGASADLFISADFKWVNYLCGHKLIREEQSYSFIKNELVIIANKDFAGSIVLEPTFDIASAFGGRMAMGNPEYVPAGMYAKEAFTNIGWWNSLGESQIAKTRNVRAALNLVETGQCQLGVVYKTDALASKKVRIVAYLPSQSHKPIYYYIAMCFGCNDQTAAFVEFMKSEDAGEIYQASGFELIDE